ncbi:MAG: beta-propeller fold lactonase family protein, partial [Burkholderiaceae bacterium]
MKTTRRDTFRLLGAPLAMLAVPLGATARGRDDALHTDKVFTITNAAAGNELLVFAPDDAGGLALTLRAATQGAGSGAGLGSQGAVALSGDGRHAFAVNAGSNTVSTFLLRGRALELVSSVDAGGLHPISVTERDGVVVVLNDGGAGNLAAFRNHNGQLSPIAGGHRPLSAAGGTGPAQVSFSSDGEAVVVSEKNTHRLLVYRVADDGRLGAPVVTPSAGQVPFGFAFDRRNRVFVTEASASTVSSYRLDGTTLRTLSASVVTTQGAACWMAVTPNGRYCYSSNTSSDSISSFRIGRDGRIELLAAVAAAVNGSSTPVDSAISAGGHSLYLLDRGNRRIVAYAIAPDGSLTTTGATATNSLPA